MFAEFFGSIAPTSENVGAPTAAGGFETHSLSNGTISHLAGVPCLRRDHRICLAQGEPRFDDPALAAIQQQYGTPAAWLEAFERGSAKAPAQAKGRFSVVIIDDEANEVWMATDRFASWPLCHAERNGVLFLSDRADAVPISDRRLSPQSIFEYLYFHAISSPATAFEGVHRLEPAHVLHWRRGQTEIHPYWQPVFVENENPNFESSRQTFLDIIREGVAREAAGHEVGAFLSGGTDSSTVSGMLCKALGGPAQTYSIGFDAAGYDELEYARLAAKHFGTKHHEYYVTPDDLLAGIPEVAAAYDQPFGNSSAVPAWICADRARQEGIEKMLAGDGGDELFGGNVRYAKQRIFGHYDYIPKALRTALLEPFADFPGVNRIPMIKKGVSYIEQARVPMPDRLQMYNMLQRLGLDKVLSEDFLAQVDTTRPLALQRTTWHATQAKALINRMLAYDWKYTLADNDIPKVVGTTRLAGVQVGFPLLSEELLMFSLKLPPEWKLKGLTLRWFFKEALRGFLPDEIITKKKHGFGLPFGIWACQHAGLKKMAADALASFKTRGIVRPQFVDELLNTHLPAYPGYYGEMVWILMMMEFWMRAHPDVQMPQR